MGTWFAADSLGFPVLRHPGRRQGAAHRVSELRAALCRLGLGCSIIPVSAKRQRIMCS